MIDVRSQATRAQNYLDTQTASVFVHGIWHIGIGNQKSQKILTEKGYNVIVTEKLTVRELGSYLENIFQEEKFISDYIEIQLAPICHLLPVKAIEKLKLDVYEFDTFGFPNEYVNKIRFLLIQRFDGWNVRDFDDYLWRLLHEDAVASNTAEIDKTDPNAAGFWLRVLGTIALEGADARFAPENVTLESHALLQLERHLAQLESKMLFNKDKREVWAALNVLNARVGYLSQKISKKLELKIDDNLNEELLDEWLMDWDEIYPVNAYHAKEFKAALLRYGHNGKTLGGLAKESKTKARDGYTGDDTLEKLIEHAADMAFIQERNDQEEDDARYDPENQ